MQVKRNFDKVYQSSEDPWAIGPADSDRYNQYCRWLEPYVRGKTMLDIGCGIGAFLNRFDGVATELHGIEVCPEAIARGSKRHSNIHFHLGSAGKLPAITSLPREHFGFILCSDVLYYLKENQKRSCLTWIRDHLEEGGVCCLAGWSPGGHYFRAEEFADYIKAFFRPLEIHYLADTQHLLVIATKRKSLVAITIDYETWQPLPSGKSIDWDINIFQPTKRLLKLAEQVNVPLTFFAEMGEYFYLKKHDPANALLMEQQWCEIIRQGHDVQLHLHPSWLPECGAKQERQSWYWDTQYAKIENYPGDLSALIQRCQHTLETLLRPIRPTYCVTTFRAGAYQAQPFGRLWQALKNNHIVCDTSVHWGGFSLERGYDYRFAYTRHSPYFASSTDPQLKAPPTEEAVIELPVFCHTWGQKWMLDGNEGNLFGIRLLKYLKTANPIISAERLRFQYHCKRLMNAVCSFWPRLKLFLHHAGSTKPKPPQDDHDRYFVLIGHTKSELNVEAIAQQIELLKAHGLTFVSMSDACLLAQTSLKFTHASVPNFGKDTPPSSALQRFLPFDCDLVLNLHGAQSFTNTIARDYPWMQIVDCDLAEGLAFPNAHFDCLYANHSLQHAVDVQKTLLEAFCVLKDNGVLVAAIPLTQTCSNWTATPEDIRVRLQAAGFEKIVIHQDLSIAYIQAWKHAWNEVDRVSRLMQWVYTRLDPTRPNTCENPIRLLTDGYGYCIAYTVVLGKFLQREGFAVIWITMHAEGHIRGRGPKQQDTHEVIELYCEDKIYTLDPTTNRIFPYSIEALLKTPALATERTDVDNRYKKCNYHLYDTHYWYSKVKWYKRRILKNSLLQSS
ncbi:MAG: hypothetical protein A2Y14_02555 [Verrucomicrobia bacterium GWF2_51_19]|nr:MAG: hypothetical protein A2Y14_02555 [Verrucomicrobia bacterium GWF2_51_19]HCJ11996.1 hypothetical protein [Opitutae bacterium]